MAAVQLAKAAAVTAMKALAGVLIGQVVEGGSRIASFSPRYSAAAA